MGLHVGADADETNKITFTIDTMSSAGLGAIQNRLEHTINNLDNVVENTTSAESQIRDTDMAEEMVEYSKNNILAQAGSVHARRGKSGNTGCTVTVTGGIIIENVYKGKYVSALSLFAYKTNGRAQRYRYNKQSLMKSTKRENGMQTEKTIVLTISLLVSGRKETTLRCLDSLHPLMESITSELILVDTGCSSTFLDQLRSYADRIIPFVWCDDFSMARNAGLSQARGEWFLYIDDDEWFEDTGAIETFFTSGEYKEYGYANYVQRNFLTRNIGFIPTTGCHG